MQPATTVWHEPVVVQAHFTPASRRQIFDVTFPWRSIFLFFPSLARDAVTVGVKTDTYVKFYIFNNVMTVNKIC